MDSAAKCVVVASALGTAAGWVMRTDVTACVTMATAAGCTTAALLLGADARKVGFIPPAIGLCGYLALRAIEELGAEPIKPINDEDLPRDDF